MSARRSIRSAPSTSPGLDHGCTCRPTVQTRWARGAGPRPGPAVRDSSHCIPERPTGSPSPFAGYAAGMGLPAGYQLRAPTPGDLERVSAVFAADDLDDAGQVVLDEGFLGEQWSRVDFDLATDAWVVVDDVRDDRGLRARIIRGDARRASATGSGSPSSTGEQSGDPCHPEPVEERAEPPWPPAGVLPAPRPTTPTTRRSWRSTGPTPCASVPRQAAASVQREGRAPGDRPIVAPPRSAVRRLSSAAQAHADRAADPTAAPAPQQRVLQAVPPDQVDAITGMPTRSSRRPAGLPRRPRRGVRRPLGSPSRAVRPLGRGADTESGL